jgi:hypothetical protein
MGREGNVLRSPTSMSGRSAPRTLAVLAVMFLEVGCASYDVEATDASPVEDDADRDSAPAQPDSGPDDDRPRVISVAIPANEAWVDTGHRLSIGEHVRVTADGAVQFDESVTAVGPEGTPVESWQAWNIVFCVNHASLIGRIGESGEPFFIGPEALFAAADEGNLFLGVNDSKVVDNSGAGFLAFVETDMAHRIITSTPVAVSGTATWTDAGIDVTSGTQLTVSASGTVFVNSTLSCDPGGLRDRPDYDMYEVMACAPHAALIAKVGESGAAFLIGRSESVAAPADGRLYLGVNDNDVSNNSGAFAAAVTLTDPTP